MDVQDIAREAFAVLGTGRQLAPFSKAYPDFGLKDAYKVTAAVRAEREARGERPIGRKIGFTNRTIWAEYGVHAPIWGYVYDSTVGDLIERGARGLPRVVWPNRASSRRSCLASRLRPRRTWMRRLLFVASTGSPTASRSCSQSSRIGHFRAPDTVAAYGLHGRLFIGPRHSADSRRGEWARELSRFEIDLFRNGALVDHGVAANVLDGPLFALRHLAETLAQDPFSPPLAAGEIVTTGTLTRAFPVAAGEEWTTKLSGIPLEGARIRFV